MSRIFFGHLSLLSLAMLVLAACTPPSSASYLNRGGPESLIDVSSEVVNLSASNQAELAELSSWIQKDQPTRAQLSCLAGNNYCTQAQKILDKHAVPVMIGQAGDNSVTLVYERILARDCNQRFVDNRDNFYNTNHAGFGCATAANMVQQVTNKQEFINPSLSGDPSAKRAVNDMQRAYTPRAIVKPYTIDSSVVARSKSGN